MHGPLIINLEAVQSLFPNNKVRSLLHDNKYDFSDDNMGKELVSRSEQ